ncbi:6507_t:CDS:2 [Acaulospora morrowiae]|uniref:6507_t:CDS:1 n=1 Tax=Acaulospora morrowiae TaxID=94023 RepID=A0A9N8ZBL0_9GLOM|nr:6507_t:CDS:2 [Acaulospora morrowiae]
MTLAIILEYIRPHGTIFIISAFVTLFVIIAFKLSEDKVVEFSVSVPAEAKPGWNGGKILDKPNLKDPKNLGYIQCYDPATGQLLDIIKAHTEKDVSEALRKARNAQKKWAQTSFAERRTVLKSLLNFIVKNQEEICWVSCRDTGKTFVDAKFGEIMVTCEKIRWTIKNGEKAISPQYRESPMIMPYKVPKIVFEPLGVVAALISWNYPFHNSFGPIISALFAGNGILVKCSEQVAWSMNYFSQIIKNCLAQCGHDPDVVQFLCGFPDCGEALVRSGVDGITFIGSPQVGRKVMQSASATLTPCILELGGKDCAIIRHDANLDRTIPIVLRGVFQNSGQNCIGLERIIVHEKLHDEFVKRVYDKVKLMRVGCSLNDEDRVDVGAITMSDQSERITALIKSAVSAGATLVHGGHPYFHPNYKTAQYYTPTLLTNVTSKMEISQTEVFAPVMVIMKFKTDEEAIEIANSAPYGLGNSIFTSNQDEGDLMARKLKCGMVGVNDFGVTYMCNLPFGGVGGSGFGRFGGVEGMRSQCLMKSVALDRYPSLIQTTIPQALNYPISTNGSMFVNSLIRAIYGNSLVDKIKASITMIQGGKRKF